MAKKTGNALKARLVKELLRYIDKDKCIEHLRSVQPYKAADYLMHMIRDACEKSTFHSFNGTLYAFDGLKYSPIDYNDFHNIIYECMRKIGLPDGYYQKLYYIIKVCRSAAMSKKLYPEASVVTFANCVYDVDAREKFRFSSSKISVTSVDYDYVEDAYCPGWRAFLDEVLPEKEYQMALQEFLGCVFIDRKRAKVEKMMVLLGSGANGKSVVHDVVRGLLGEDNVGSYGMAELTGGYDMKKNISGVNGKRLNYAPEIGANTFQRVSDNLKKIISGEPVVGRENYQQNFTAENIPLMMANANRLPRMNAEEVKSVSRRFIILPFNVEIPPSRQNTALATELKTELPGIFNWVLEGRERYIANGYSFSNPRLLDDTTIGFRMESSTALEFMLEKSYDADPRETMEKPKYLPSAALFKEYSEWCMLRNKPMDSIVSHQTFGRILVNAGYRRRTHYGRVAYAVYADKVNCYDVIEPTFKTTESKYKKLIDAEGRKWVATIKGIAKELNVTERSAREAQTQGAFSPGMRKEGNTIYYEVEKCRKSLAVFIQAKSYNQKEKVDPQIAIKRGKFNQRMTKIGEPYRKYGTNSIQREFLESSGLVLVPDDWDYDVEIPVSEQSPLIKRKNRHTMKIINIEDSNV